MERIIQILLIEDNLGDIRLIQEVMKESPYKHELNIVTDGEQAIQYVRKEGKYKDALTPNLILLDLNLPKKDGREVLVEIKSTPGSKLAPVVIFSSSEADKDVQRVFESHANAYVVKPFDFNRFSQVIQSIMKFWLEVVRLP